MTDKKDNPLSHLEQALRSEIATAVREETADGGSVPAARMARIERLAKLLQLASSSKVQPVRKRWPLVVVAVATLMLLSLLLFTHVPRTEIELEVTVDQADFNLPGMQALTRTLTTSTLGMSGLRQARAPGLQAGDAIDLTSVAQVITPTTTAYLVTDTSHEHGAAITLAPLVYSQDTRLRVQSIGEDALRISWAARSQTIQADLSGAVKLSLDAGVVQRYVLSSPRPLLLYADGETVDLDLRPDKPDRSMFEDQLQATGLSFSRVDQSLDPANTILRKVSSIKSGTLYLESLGGQQRPVRDGEALEFDESSGIIRSLRLTDAGLVLRFRGTVSGMRTGWGDAQRSLMPSLLEWLKAQHGLSLLWGAALYVLGISVSLMKWLGFDP